MKKILLASALLSLNLMAATEAWTSKDGRTAQLELTKTSGEGDTLAGEFLTSTGKKITIKATDLDSASAEKLKAAASAPATTATSATEAQPSVFDEILDGNLTKLDGKKLKSCKDATKPAKYYIFYYTASWCGPCQQFTPTLVKFYNEAKPNNNNFELVLITSDEDEKDMEGYAVDKKMPWPQLELSKVTKWDKKFDHGVTGIPAVVVCDLEGKIIAKTRSTEELKKLVK